MRVDNLSTQCHHGCMAVQADQMLALSRQSSPKRKPLGVRVTPEQHAVLTEAARREHRSVSSFVLQSALRAAQQTPNPKRKSIDEVRAIVEAAQEEVAARVPPGRSFLHELMNERRGEAEHG